MTNLWSSNTPESFWLCRPAIPAEVWQAAAKKVYPVLGLPANGFDWDEMLRLTLGEGQFGPDHWTMSRAKRLYYQIKPLLPRKVINRLRRLYKRSTEHVDSGLAWPVESRYVRFQWALMRECLLMMGCQSIQHLPFWPQTAQAALVLTHDIETSKGQDYVRAVADLEEQMGFRSSFNFVPERYPIDHDLVDELRARGFEIGIHGLHHDGKLFSSPGEFARRAQRINHHLKQFEAVGFRTPYTHRQPEYMQALEVEYDLSFFDTDPYEPIPGGTMTIWPFMLGRFVELPYTLAQDYTLTVLLKEQTARLWLEKVEFIRQYHGMVLVNSHPDYLLQPATWKVYAEFLQATKQMDGFWHALPREVARWWKTRVTTVPNHDEITLGEIALTDTDIALR